MLLIDSLKNKKRLRRYFRNLVYVEPTNYLACQSKTSPVAIRKIDYNKGSLKVGRSFDFGRKSEKSLAIAEKQTLSLDPICLTCSGDALNTTVNCQLGLSG